MKKMSLALLVSAGLLFAGSSFASDADAGQALSVDCADCHGEDGLGDEDFPGISGMGEADFIAAMKEYQDGTRKDKMMVKQTKGLSEEDIANLAAYYAALVGE